MNPDTQKVLADRILSDLKVISPYAVLAGGAPRDWYFGEEAKDLDFYLYSNAMTTKAARNQIASALGISVDRVVLKAEHEEGLYRTMRCLRRIFDVYDYSMPVQIMQLNEPNDEFKVVDLMSTSICRIYYEAGKLQPTKDFLLTARSKIMFVDADYNWTDPHPAKIAERFRGKFYIGTKQQAVDKLINQALFY
jgi:hypothetical protein